MAEKMWFLEKKGGSEDLPERKPSAEFINATMFYQHSWGTTWISSPSQYINHQIHQMPIRDQGDRGNAVGQAAAYAADQQAAYYGFPPPRGGEPIGGHAGGQI